MSYAYRGYVISFGAGFWYFDHREFNRPEECESAIDTLLSI